MTASLLLVVLLLVGIATVLVLRRTLGPGEPETTDEHSPHL